MLKCEGKRKITLYSEKNAKYINGFCPWDVAQVLNGLDGVMGCFGF